MVTGVAQPAGKPAAMKAPGPTVRTRHRASPRPYTVIGRRGTGVALGPVVDLDGFHGSQVPSLIAGMVWCWSGCTGRGADAVPGSHDRSWPRPGGGDLSRRLRRWCQAAACVEEAVAERLGFDLGVLGIR
jgi:hypothetical protein